MAMLADKLIQGDCIPLMQEMETDSVDAFVSDPPPYLMGYMGKKWDSDGSPTAWHERWLVEALRVAKPGAHLAAFSAPRTYHWLASGAENVGWEIRDSLQAIRASGMPPSAVALKPAHDPILLARKPFKGSMKLNIAALGTRGP